VNACGEKCRNPNPRMNDQDRMTNFRIHLFAAAIHTAGIYFFAAAGVAVFWKL
jgi:hypothetical protein